MPSAPRRSRSLAVGALLLAAACAGHETDGRSQLPASSPPPPSAPATTAPSPVSYTVRRGDNLAAIAKQFGVSVDAIVAANHLPSQDQIAEGQVLTIPPAPPIGLNVTPSDGRPGTAFQLSLTGARTSETITFEIDAPDGKKFTGPPHTATSDGAVTAKYQTAPGDPAGSYTVVATGDQGTNAHAAFTVDSAASGSSSSP